MKTTHGIERQVILFWTWVAATHNVHCTHGTKDTTQSCCAGLKASSMLQVAPSFEDAPGVNAVRVSLERGGLSSRCSSLEATLVFCGPAHYKVSNHSLQGT